MDKYKDLNNLLKIYKVKKGQDYTHTSMAGGSYYIPDENYDNFLLSYSYELIKEKELYLTEKHKEYSPLLIDFDFKIDMNEENEIKDRYFEIDLIIEFCESLIQFLGIIIKNENNFDYVILSRPSKYSKDHIIKDGVHIIFPNLIIPVWFGYYIRLQMIRELEKILLKSTFKYINNIYDIYDEAVIDRNNWTLFGSTKKSLLPYRIHYIKTCNSEIKNIFKSIVKEENEILNIDTSIENSNTILNNHIDYEKYKEDKIFQLYGVKKKYLLDVIKLLSIRNKNTENTVKFFDENFKKKCIEELQNLKLLKDNKKKIKNNKNLIKFGGADEEITEQELQAITKFINESKSIWNYMSLNVYDISKKIYGLDPHYFVRLNHPNPSEKISCPFKGEPHNRDSCPIYLHIWKGGAVMKCFDNGVSCAGKSFPENPIPIPTNIQSLIFNNVTIVNFNAKNIENEDNDLLDFEEDSEIIKVFDNEYLNKLILNSLNGTHYDIAKVLYELYKNDFRCISLDGKNNWYEFSNHKWVLGSIRLRQHISENLTKYYNNIKKEYKKNIYVILDASKKDNMISGLIKKLKTTSFKNNIMSECCEIFCAHNQNFVNKLDENKNLICFENGVFDLENNIFRDGKPDDNLSISTGYDYIENYSDRKQELLDFLESIQPHQEEREYLLKFVSSCFHGDNPEELFHIFSGRTRNGKSKLRDLLKNTFGNYYSSISSNLLTKERPSTNNPQPDIMGLKGKRLIIGSEPEKGQKINTGFMKFLTGNDPIKGRGMFEKNEYEYKPQFKVLLLCNDIPDMDSNDEGVWSRSRVVEFPITFVKEPKEDYERQIDTDLGNKLMYWHNDFFLLLMENYVKYKKEGLLPTKRIMEFTYEYRMETDRYLSFLNERTINVNKKNLHTCDLYDDFKSWFIKNNPNEKVPSNSKFVQGIKKHRQIERSVRIGKKVNTGVKNIAFKDDNYDSESDE
jgi:P4 family phage/plasmid primase-like protien